MQGIVEERQGATYVALFLQRRVHLLKRCNNILKLVQYLRVARANLSEPRTERHHMFKVVAHVFET